MSEEFGIYSEYAWGTPKKLHLSWYLESHSRPGVHLNSGFNFFCYKIPAISLGIPVLPDLIWPWLIYIKGQSLSANTMELVILWWFPEYSCPQKTRATEITTITSTNDRKRNPQILCEIHGGSSHLRKCIPEFWVVHPRIWWADPYSRKLRTSSFVFSPIL